MMTFPVYLIFSSADSFLLAYDRAQIYFILKETIKKSSSTLVTLCHLSFTFSVYSFHFLFTAKFKSILSLLPFTWQPSKVRFHTQLATEIAFAESVGNLISRSSESVFVVVVFDVSGVFDTVDHVSF